MTEFNNDFTILDEINNPTGTDILILQSETLNEDLMNNPYHEELIQTINDHQNTFRIILDDNNLDNYYIISYEVNDINNYELNSIIQYIASVFDTCYNYNYDLMPVNVNWTEY